MPRLTLCILLLTLTRVGHAQDPSTTKGHVTRFEDLTWQADSPGLEIAIAEGDPEAAGQPFTMMLRLKGGSWIPSHWHNVPKWLVVVSGEMRMGHGDTIDSTQAMSLRPGSVVVVPEGQHHYEGARGPTVIALHAVGPFQTTFVRKTR